MIVRKCQTVDFQLLSTPFNPYQPLVYNTFQLRLPTQREPRRLLLRLPPLLEVKMEDGPSLYRQDQRFYPDCIQTASRMHPDHTIFWFFMLRSFSFCGFHTSLWFFILRLSSFCGFHTILWFFILRPFSFCGFHTILRFFILRSFSF